MSNALSAERRESLPISGLGHSMPFGAELRSDGQVRFRVWAPACPNMAVRIEGERSSIPMEALPGGWHELVSGRAGAGTLYRYELPDGRMVPDPASRFQPRDVHGPSMVVDPSGFRWTDRHWGGRPWTESVIYELHVGTFTPEGTFRAAIGKLDHLAGLGVTAVDIMPVADFAGRRNWGYDGVLPYAPDSSYGAPDDLRALVDAAHARRLMVFLDVVYNHFGPDGNYLGLYAPQFFTDRHTTPWGQAIDYDGPDSRAVRDFAIHNALYWIEEFHIDGLRLDAVHAIPDDSDKILITELAERVRAVETGRPVHLILENEDNEARHLVGGGAVGRYTAQWNDDVHHVLHAAATREGAGYYQDYLGDTTLLGRALAEGFAFQGQTMRYRGSPRGEPSGTLPPYAFVTCIQNHDQVGNRAFGDRLTAIALPEALRAISAVYLLLPQIPMLFMGEEWGTSQPFPFFCDFEGDLGEAVRNGRREEFKRFPEFADAAARALIPDPQAEDTFLLGKLNWFELDLPPYRTKLDRYTQLLAVRRRRILPLLERMGGNAGRFDEVGPLAVATRWRTSEGAELHLEANLKDEAQAGFSETPAEVIWQEGHAAGGVFGPWAVRWSVTPASPDRAIETGPL